MTSADTQLLKAFEAGKTPEEIADDLGFHTHHVKARLMSLSSVYRKACGAESPEADELNFTHEEQLTIKRELYQLAITAEDPHLKAKILLNLRDDGKGRKDVVRAIQNNGPINILQLVNAGVAQARQSAQNIRQQFTEVKSIP